jgi:hypothetical protein
MPAVLELKAYALYTKQDAGRLMNLGYAGINHLIAAGKLKTERVGQRDLIRGVSIAQLTGADIPNVPAPAPVSRKTEDEIMAARRRRNIPLNF